MHAKKKESLGITKECKTVIIERLSVENRVFCILLLTPIALLRYMVKVICMLRREITRVSKRCCPCWFIATPALVKCMAKENSNKVGYARNLLVVLPRAVSSLLFCICVFEKKEGVEIEVFPVKMLLLEYLIIEFGHKLKLLRKVRYADAY